MNRLDITLLVFFAVLIMYGSCLTRLAMFDVQQSSTDHVTFWSE